MATILNIYAVLLLKPHHTKRKLVKNLHHFHTCSFIHTDNNKWVIQNIVTYCISNQQGYSVKLFTKLLDHFTSSVL